MRTDYNIAHVNIVITRQCILDAVGARSISFHFALCSPCEEATTGIELVYISMTGATSLQAVNSTL